MSDLISRESVISLIRNENSALRDIFISHSAGEDLIKWVNELPSVNPQPKTGHWIEEDMFDGDVAYRCSECNELFWIESGTPKDNGYNFCPKCGKKLVEPQERSE